MNKKEIVESIILGWIVLVSICWEQVGKAGIAYIGLCVASPGFLIPLFLFFAIPSKR